MTDNSPPDVPEVSAEEIASKARLFDIRRLIGGLFVVYGLIVGGYGLFHGKSDAAKAAGVRINLWTGLGMVVIGLLFLAWMWLRPAEPPAPEEDAEQSLVSPPGRS